MSRAMAESISQQDFYGDTNMYYMAFQSFSEGQTEADLFYNYHLDLQESMQDSITFHAEVIGDVMYFHQVIKKADV